MNTNKILSYFRGNLGLFSLFVIGCLFFYNGIVSGIILYNWNLGASHEFFGGYTISERDGLHNSYYVFSLHNGDTVSVPCEHLACDVEELFDYKRLYFYYFDEDSLFFNRPNGISIFSDDKTAVILDGHLSGTVLRTEMIVFLVLGILCMCSSAFPVVLCLFIEIK